jgi:glutamine amidotransferase
MIAIIDYKAGNLASVERAVRSVGFACRITRDPREILEAERVIFPGVGAAGAAMADLQATGLDRVLRDLFARGTPLLGICLGTQVVFDFSEEDGGTPCLGLMKGWVKRFPSDMKENGYALKVPHMGWNQVRLERGHPVLSGLQPDEEFYFVHSYYPEPADAAEIVGLTDYGLTFASIVAEGSFIAAQFHLEKSGRPGIRILKNFCGWDGKNA